LKIYIGLILALVITLVITPMVRKLAIYLGAMDAPSKRKVHTEPMPRMGGLAIFVSFWISVFATQEITTQVLALFAGSLVIVISGIWDDCKNIKPWIKLVFQFAAAAIAMIYGGVRVEFISQPIIEGFVFLKWLWIPVTFFWIVGLTNAVNLIDGLDGLAAGVSAISALAIGIVTYINGFYEMGNLAFILAVATAAFLKYNFHPAKLFMGDTGALFLGYTLAVISVLGMTKTTTAVTFFLPIIVLEVPIFDTLFAIVRRVINKKPIFGADKDHLHHRLLAMGFSHTKAVLVVYAVCITLSISAILISMLPNRLGLVFAAIVTIIMVLMAGETGLLGNKKVKSVKVDNNNENKGE